MSTFHPLRSGIVAGLVSVFTFAIIHDLFISDIWFSLPMMLVAGGVCGLCIAWTYSLSFETPSLSSWLRYNALYVGMFALIGVVSVLSFEPVATIPELMVLNGPPDHLIRQALPMTVISTLVMAALISRIYARRWAHFAAILLTCTVLVLLLGLNVSVIGLVYIPGSQMYLILELFGLILVLNLVYVAAFAGLEWKRFFSPGYKPVYPA